VFTYSIVKAITLLLTVAVGLYLTILVLNLGGYVDRIFAAYIDESIGGMIQAGWLKDTPEPGRTQIIDHTRLEMQDAAGLNQPFLLRTFRWLVSGMTLDLGQGFVQHYYSSQSGSVREIIVERLPYTLALIGAANILVFVSSILVALYLSRQHGSLPDRLFIFLAPMTSAPSWIIGIILVAIFAAWLGILPYPRVIRVEPAEYSLDYFMMVGRQMILPIMAVFIGAFFQGVYTWRTYFLIYANEDYVEMARANGLPARLIERRHILRPVLPYVITSFATTMILLWQGSFALELLFYWPGVGLLFLNSLRSFNNPISLGVVVIFAYLLAITVFLLEITYALVDPRVRLGSQCLTVRPARARRNKQFFSRKTQIPVPWQNTSIPIINSSDEAGFDLRRYFSEKKRSTSRWFQSRKPTLRELFRYPSTTIGLVLIAVLVGLSIIPLLPSHIAGLWYYGVA
jgi:peptide/nickel transport system permease protein